jgi:endonuclease/exonuclease/phosphatase family metal-dependent hydrolase
VPYRDERLPHIIDALEGIGADVVCLQEVFSIQHCERLTSTLRKVYPHFVRHDNGNRLRLSHGLLTLSKFPVRRSAFVPFATAPRFERFWIRRGALAATMDLGADESPINIVNVHTTSGGRGGSETSAADRVRDMQIRELHAVASALPGRTLICGDFNAGPEASPKNYKTILSKGYIDAFALLHPEAAGVTPAVTWDPTNELNDQTGRFADSPPQRVDHIFLNGSAMATLEAAETRIEFEAPRVPVAGKTVTLSDHFGLFVRLKSRTTIVT